MIAPTAGQLAVVRQRRWVVTDVRPGGLSAFRDEGRALAEPEHLVALQSIEDDAHGETLEVVWEIEPGVRVIERDALPDPRKGFDDPARLDAFLDAVRWGAVASADSRQLHAPFRSGITIEDYQLDPVARALQMPRVNLLIADDVGLGKTIEAGLVVQELLLRHRARTILVVCPAGLQLQWRDQMRDKFGLEFRIVDSELMKELRRRRGLHVNPWTHFPRLITSIDFLKRERPMRLFQEVLGASNQTSFLRRLDLLIVDEAHNIAPAGRDHYAVDSQRTQAIRSLAPHFEHKLFLSATPHNGYSESFSALLELLDNQRFARGVTPDRTQLAAVMVRRLKRELPPDDLGRPRFPERRLDAVEVDWEQAERQAHADLVAYTKLRLGGARDATEKFATEFVLKLLKKRLFSSPQAFLLTLEKHLATLRGGVRRPKVQAMPTLRLLQREVDGLDEEDDDDTRYEERAEEAVETTSAVFRPLAPQEEQLLDRMLKWAERASGTADAKARELLRWLEETLRPGGKWNDTRVILFTEYRATQKWLQGLLGVHGLSGGDRLKTLYGGMATQDREAVKAAFQAAPDLSPVRILLATDAASEGIDLQNHCSRLVHYEIPWNPNRMEQRNGRVDRHGQRAGEVEILHFVGKGFDASRTEGRPPGDLEGDLEFLMRAAIKVDRIREDLGNAGDVIAQRVEEAMLGRRRSLGDPEVESRRARDAREALKFQRQLDEQLARLRQRLAESRDEMRLSPLTLKAVVDVALDLAGLPPLLPATIPGPDAKGAVAVWHLPGLPGTWAPCAEGLAHPHTHEIRPITFDHAVAQGRDDVVLAHLNHRLVQMSLRLLRTEVWAPEGKARLNRVSARVVPDTAIEHPALLAHARLVVVGGDGVRIHEEIVEAGGSLKEGRFDRLNVGETARAVAASRTAGAHPAPEGVTARLADLWGQHEGQVRTALEARMRERARSLENHLEERAAREARDIKEVLSELARTIEQEIGRAAPAQLSLWSDPEREQLERNRDALTRRLQSIPDEIAREEAAIRARYADPQPRLFPVALTWVVPERLARN